MQVSFGASVPPLAVAQEMLARPVVSGLPASLPADAVTFGGSRTAGNVGIVATLGPATGSKEKIRALAQSGVTMFRLNYSHINTPEAREKTGQYIEWVREVSKEGEAQGKKPLKVFADLQGPKIRAGDLPDDGIHIEKGESVYLSSGIEDVRPGHIPVTLPEIVDALQPGNRVLMDDGKLELVVKEAPAPDGDVKKVRCQVIRGGFLKDSKGINMPGVKVAVDSLSDEDRLDLRDALSRGVDAVAVSFVRSAEDPKQVRQLAKELGRPDIQVISKIEQQEAVDSKILRQITAASDILMVARGDLALEINNIADLPGYERKIIREAKLQGKQVIMATQMLESMLESPIPSRSDMSGIAAAVREGSNFLMLSGETATGSYPMESVQLMRSIINGADCENSTLGRGKQLLKSLLDSTLKLIFKIKKPD